jgi:hypothetical protein
MHRRYSTRPGVLTLTALEITGLATSAFAQSSTIVIAPSAPPPPQVETISPPPTYNAQVMTWQPGHWAWNGANWAWIEGQYVQRPQPTAEWEPGHWSQQTSGGYIWVDGHWRS